MATTEPWEVAAFKPEFQAAFAQAMRKPASPELGLGGHSAIQAGNSEVLLQGIPPKPYEEMFQCWDLEFQEFLEAEDFPWEDSRLQDGLTPWENTDAFLASFQQVALACRWPRKEWVNRLLPALDRDGEEAFRSLDDKDQGDFWKVKMAILQREAMNRERKRQQFRRFCYQEANGPREVCFQLQHLCHQWLKAEWQTKEQILEQLILEQFLAILPKEMQAWVREQRPVTCNQAVTMAESFLRKLLAAETQEGQHPQEPNDVAIDYSKTKSSQQDRDLLWTKKDIRVDSSSSRRSYPNYSEVRRGREKSLEWECLEQTECWPKSRGRPSKASLYQLKQEDAIKERRRSERLRGIYPENRPNYSPPLEEASKKFCKTSHSPETPQGRTKICPENRPDHSPPQEEGSKKFCKAPLSPETPQSRTKICLECGQSFSGISSLTRHQARCHTKEKRHACCFCSRAFCWKSDLARHESMHTGRKPHECQFCGEGFYRKWQRKKHELVHEKVGKRF